MINQSELRHSCQDFLKDKISVMTCFQILENAQKFSLKPLEEAAEKYILRKFGEVSRKNKKFKEMPVDTICKFLQDDQLHGHEIGIFRAARQWLDFTPEREEYLSRIMSNIRFTAIPADLLGNELMRDDFLRLNDECLKMVVHAMTYHANVFTQHLDPTPVRGCKTFITCSNRIRRHENRVRTTLFAYQLESLQAVSETEIKSSWKHSLDVTLRGESVNLASVTNFLFLLGTVESTSLPILKRFEAIAEPGLIFHPCRDKAQLEALPTLWKTVLLVLAV